MDVRCMFACTHAWHAHGFGTRARVRAVGCAGVRMCERAHMDECMDGCVYGMVATAMKTVISPDMSLAVTFEIQKWPYIHVRAHAHMQEHVFVRMNLHPWYNSATCPINPLQK